MRLRKLVVSGFKSFADRMEFDFEAGVTCIVGPNGCGKSNVVDAIKWSLGEQSAKNLRGKEMLDVIFNGTASRKAMTLAEVQLIFDNADRVLPIACDEVQVGRRLFRSGESEYLINKSPARLKDIRDLFFDTGVGRTGYSIIEQGRISQFVESNPKDRRTIFEEAAGISKFKVRIQEASRKLEAVNGNLARAGDVMDEIERQLRSVKIQAGRARTFQQLSDRLRALRTLHVQAEYRRFSAELAQARERLSAGQAALEQASAKSAAAAARVDELTARQDELAQALRLAESARDATESQIKQGWSQIKSGEERLEDQARSALAAEQRAVSQRDRLAALAAEAATHQQQADALQAEIEAAHHKIAEAQSQAAAAARAQADLQAQLDDENSGLMDLIRRTTRLHSETEGLGRQADQLAAQHQRVSSRSEQLRAEMGQQVGLQDQLHEKLKEIEALLGEQNAALEAKRHEAQQLGDQRAALLHAIGEAKQRRSALQSRQNVLADLQRRREGVAVGPRSVLDRSGPQAGGKSGGLPGVLGMVADLFSADARHARAVEAALGSLAQAVIVESREAILAHQADIASLPGRVTFICLDELPAPVAAETPPAPAPLFDDADLQATYERCTAYVAGLLAPADAAPAAEPPCPRDPCIHAGVIGRASDLVTCDQRFAALRDALLGQTLLVESLAAVQPHRALWPADTRWVSLDGQVIAAQAGVPTWAVGPADKGGDGGAGLISRRAELADLEQALLAVENELADLQQQAAAMGEALTHSEKVQQELRQAIYGARTEQTDLKGQLIRVQEAIRRLTMEEPLLANEAAEIARRLEAAHAQRQSNQQELEGLAQRKAQHDEAVASLQKQLAEATALRQQHATADARAREAMAGLAARRSAALSALAAVRRQGDEATRLLNAAQAEIADAAARSETLHRAILAARGLLAEACWKVEHQARAVAELAAQRDQVRAELGEEQARLKSVQAEQATAQTQAHQAAVDVSAAELRVENVVTRAREDLKLDLGAASPAAVSGLERGYEDAVVGALRAAGVEDVTIVSAAFRPSHVELNVDWDAVTGEISDLKAKLDRLGNVNLDAINELAHLEERQSFLAGQRDDLQRAATQLSELIERLNNESRQRFAEAFAAIRENFAVMFRKLFGGGKADIVLEKNPDGTEADVLDAGIEILARPPGMETKTLSLLSGGQKAMIAVALLMSIFQSRPSPFCILDEVDAPLDDANNLRFNAIVKEFLAFTQFIVITHSKSTMTMADRLYGVTMQEPGVSKKVGVSFDAAGKARVQDEADAPAAGAA